MSKESKYLSLMGYKCICSRQHRRNPKDSDESNCSFPKSFLSWWIREKSKNPRAYINEESKKLRKEKSCGCSDDGERNLRSAIVPNYAQSCQVCSRDHDGEDSSGNHKEVTPFNLGSGFGLVYLHGKSKTEVNKIKDMDKEMEVAVQNEKDILCAIGSFEIPQSSLCSKELEAELDHRKIHTESQTMLYEEGKYTKVVVEDAVPEGIFNTKTYGKNTNSPSHVIHNEERQAVSPHELERKLHELLETRQQERINELEEVLHCSRQKIHEKERELAWWKDTAKLFFRHLQNYNERGRIDDTITVSDNNERERIDDIDSVPDLMGNVWSLRRKRHEERRSKELKVTCKMW